MKEFDFYLFKGRYNDRFICYESQRSVKVVADYSRIPYTAETLFEDMLDGFSAYTDFDHKYDSYERLGIPYVVGEELIETVQNAQNLTQIAHVCFFGEAFLLEIELCTMDHRDFLLFSGIEKLLVGYCKENGLELNVNSNVLPITEFVNSRDVRGYLEEIGYVPSALESVWLVWQSKNHTLKQKHTAFKRIIEGSDDVAIPGGRFALPMPSLHRFTERYMELELGLVEEFFKEESGAVYTVREYFSDMPSGEWYDSTNVFASFAEAEAYIDGFDNLPYR